MGVNWNALLDMLTGVEQHFEDVPEWDHKPDEAMSYDGSRYCRGCEVGSSAQALRIAVEDYMRARGIATRAS